jgi:tRNA G10  N-methylase Trm11
MKTLLLYADVHEEFRTPETLSILRESRGGFTLATPSGKNVLGPETNKSLLHVLESTPETAEYLRRRSVTIKRTVRVLGEVDKVSEDTCTGKTYRIGITSYIGTLSPEEKRRARTWGYGVIERSGGNEVSGEYEIVCAEAGTFVGKREETFRKKALGMALRKREFIGTTAMDSEIAFIMANLAGVKRSDIVLDLYCGTGSLLLPCAVRDAFIIGFDLNRRQFAGHSLHRDPGVRTMLLGKNIFSNFIQYRREERVICFSLADVFSHPLRPGTIDSILCDPPYGNREKAASISANNTAGLSMDKYLEGSRPYVDAALRASFELLKEGGRVCLFVPHATGSREVEIDMRGFAEESRSTQFLNSLCSRTLFVLRKLSERMSGAQKTGK